MRFSFFLLLTTLCAKGILANETTIIDVPQYNLEAYKSSCHTCCIPKPYGFIVDVNSIYKAPLKRDRVRGVQYGEGQVIGLYGFKLDRNTAMSINLGAGIADPILNANEYFHVNSYSNVNAGLSYLTSHFRRWFLQVGFNAQFNANKNIENRFARGTRYSALVWGRYCFSRDLGLHIGVIGFTGIQQTTAYPILGVDYQITNCLRADLVFPIYPSVTYFFNKRVSVSIVGRPFITRNRLANNAFAKNGIFEYKNAGTEISFNYNYNLLVWSIHGGYAYGGSLQIKDTKARHLDTVKFRGSPYVGANLLWRF